MALPAAHSTDRVTAARRGHVRWVICALLFFAATINYIDRQVLAILAPDLQKEIGWSELDYGRIVIAFQVAYAVMMLAWGRILDKIGTKIGFAVAVVWWSLAAMGTSFARSAMGFGAARFLLGVGEAANFPASIKTVAEWFPKSERAFSTGIFNSGTNIGAVLAPHHRSAARRTLGLAGRLYRNGRDWIRLGDRLVDVVSRSRHASACDGSGATATSVTASRSRTPRRYPSDRWSGSLSCGRSRSASC